MSSLPHASPMAGGNQEHRNRKLLEHIQEQKKRLQHGHHSSASSSTSAISVPPSPILVGTPSTIGGHAHMNSVGYFITQDSSFGNLILPVLPRINDPKADVK
ncbi:SOSS complex subunit C-like [Elysia marginata]|uniref:SOSS complex subunit C-like n=1 Tax=Elysia marginata TaxID=1093978 RepID=A0AAV4JPF9_9GAST|nr:SOSS complex subunit C-like [Elysia marginata]